MNRTELHSESATVTGPSATIAVITDDLERYRRVADAVSAAGLICPDGPSSWEALAGEPAPQIIVLDQDVDGLQMLATLRAAKEALPDSGLVVVWPERTSLDAQRALRAGADGLVGSASVAEQLGLTIRAVLSGVACIPVSMRRSLESESLSMREKQVLALLVMGLANGEIARRLFLAESTVKSHLSSAYTKLGVASRKDAANRILDPVEGLGPGILAIAAA